MFQAARAALPELLKLLPDADAPTVLGLDGEQSELSLHAVCRSALTWQRLEDMMRPGARGLLVLPVERLLACTSSSGASSHRARVSVWSGQSGTDRLHNGN